MKLREIIIKRQLKRAYIEYNRLLSPYDCGKTLAEHINPRITKQREKCNDLITKLNKVRKDKEPLSLLK